MKRLLLALAVFLTATATPTFAGYIIIRVLLEGGAGNEGSPGEPGGMGPKRPPGGFTPSVKPPGTGGPKGTPPSYPGGQPNYPGMPGGSTTPNAAPGEIDHARSIVVVVPLETDFLKGPLDRTKAVNQQNNPEFKKFAFQHAGQKLSAALYVDSSTIQLYEELLNVPGTKKTRATELRDKYQSWLRAKNDPELLYDAVVLALQSGFVKEAETYADELLVVAAEKKLTLPERIKPFVTAWGAMQKAVQDVATQPSDAAEWRDRLEAKDVRVDRHYAIVSWESSGNEVTRRGMQLNDNFKAFYLWQATRGVTLPVPNKPLVVLLASQGTAMRGLHQALDGLPMADAFYAPDHNLLVLSPERMDDVGQTFFRQNQQLFAKGLNRDQLLLGQIPKLDFTGEKGSKPDDVARASTLAAIEKLAIEEAEIAAVSREGTRQLLYATGTLPKHVTLPNWLTNGAVGFFTRPRGPAYITVGDDEKPYMHVALTTGYGVPNYVLQRHLRDFQTKKELPTDSTRLLENVLGDVYFTGIKDGDDPDPAPPSKKPKKPVGGQPKGGLPGPGPIGPGPVGPPGGLPPGGLPPMGPGAAPGAPADTEDPVVALRRKQQRLTIKANATAWSLFYYLAKDKPGELKQYVAELNKQPRDLPIDGRTALAVFTRVFKLSATDGGAPDPQRMKKFADDWLTYMNTVPLVGNDVPLVIPEPPKTTTPGGMGTRPPGGERDPDSRP